ncbi:MAG: hypothetical protein COA68_12245 [Oceanobacter sp.]|nr:MAG: hypothetical protein COA68_12245 [Oceanobacter sp.]
MKIANDACIPGVVAQEWLAALTQAQLAHGMMLTNSNKRASFESCKAAMQSLFCNVVLAPTTKTQWLVFFEKIKLIMSFFVFAASGGMHQSVDAFLYAFDTAFRDGYIDPPRLLRDALAKNGRFRDNSSPGFRKQRFGNNSYKNNNNTTNNNTNNNGGKRRN